MRGTAVVAALLLLAAASAHAHALDTPTARVTLRDDHVEVLAEVDLLQLLGVEATAIATADEAALVEHLARARRLLEAEAYLSLDGRRGDLVLRALPPPPELRALAATLSAAGREHGEPMRLRLEAPRRIEGVSRIGLALPAALGPVLVTFAQVATRHAAQGRPAEFPVLRPPGAPERAGSLPWSRVAPLLVVLLGALGLGAAAAVPLWRGRAGLRRAEARS